MVTMPHIHPTRVSTTTAKLIDNIFCNSADFNTISGNIVSTISDHFPQFLIFNNLTCNKPVENKSFVRNWKHFNEETDVSKIDWNNILELDSNKQYRLHHCTNTHHSFNLTERKKRVKSNPWVTLGIITSIYKRDSLFKSFQKEKNA